MSRFAFHIEKEEAGEGATPHPPERNDRRVDRAYPRPVPWVQLPDEQVEELGRHPAHHRDMDAPAVSAILSHRPDRAVPPD